MRSPKRDFTYRVALMCADPVRRGIAVVLGVVVIGHAHASPRAFAVLLIVPFVSKVVGLYDRDEHLIRKTTLEEVPAIFQVATLYTLLMLAARGRCSSTVSLGAPAARPLGVLLFTC